MKLNKTGLLKGTSLFTHWIEEMDYIRFITYIESSRRQGTKGRVDDKYWRSVSLHP